MHYYYLNCKYKFFIFCNSTVIDPLTGTRNNKLYGLRGKLLVNYLSF